MSNWFPILRYTFFICVVSGAAHALLVRWMLRSFPRLRTHRRAVIAVAAFVALFPIAARTVTMSLKSDLAERLYAVTMLEMMFALLSAAPFAVIELAQFIARRRTGIRTPPSAGAPLLPPSSEGGPGGLGVTRRQALDAASGAFILAGTGSALGWGMIRGRHAFAIEEVPVRIPGLPRTLDGYTIGQISDLHVGLFVGDRELREGLDRLRSFRPDLIVATGDLVDYDAGYAPRMARALADLDARDGVYAIYGNHDYYTGARRVGAALQQTKIDLLVNAGRRIRPADGGGFALLGVDDLWSRSYGRAGPRLDRALAMVPPDVPRILLAHQPKYFDEIAGQVALQLSGHTHGGQINPGDAVDLFMKYIAGRYEKQGSTLWVNRGFGVVGPPARIGAPPEVTKIVLVAA